MLIGSNQACAELAACGVSRSQAQRVLAAGLAGEAQRLGSKVMYDRDRVRELASRGAITWLDAMALCPTGLFVSRREFPSNESREAQLAALSLGWGSMNYVQRLRVDLQIDNHGYFPFVATVGGLVAIGADITRLNGPSSLELGPSGPWFDALAGRWLRTGRDRPWVLHVGPLRPAKMVG